MKHQISLIDVLVTKATFCTLAMLVVELENSIVVFLNLSGIFSNDFVLGELVKYIDTKKVQIQAFYYLAYMILPFPSWLIKSSPQAFLPKAKNPVYGFSSLTFGILIR